MPSVKYALHTGEPKRLQITWKGMWNDVVVAVDDQEVGRIPDRKALKEGRSFELPDGSHLSVRLKTGAMNQGLEVLRNGAPLPGSAADPAQQLKVATGIVYFIGGLTLLLGVVAALTKAEILLALGFGPISIGIGVLFVVLGYFVSQRSMVALGAAVLLFTADTVIGIMQAMDAGARPGVGGMVVRVFLIMGMLSGFPAIKKMKEEERAAPAEPV